MNVYLIREIESTRVHGIFWAETREDLFWTLDEMPDPLLFEYARLRHPSGIWTEKAMDDVMSSPQEDLLAEEQNLPDEIAEDFDQLGENLYEAITCQRTLHWRRFKEDELMGFYGAAE
jgi:hypothetical protein